MTKRVRRIAAASGVALGALMAAGVAVPANAASGAWIGNGGGTGMCGAQLCLYYNSAAYGYGAMFATDYGQINDLGGSYFSANAGATRFGGNPNSGKGVVVKNHAAAAEDQGASDCDFIYYNSAAYGWGNYDYLCPGQSGKLDYTYNNDAAYSINFMG